MHFSQRTGWPVEENAWTEKVRRRKAEDCLLDLTVSNPTQCGLGPETAEVLAPLRDPEALLYKPDPLGMRKAREAVRAYYLDHQQEVQLDRICLTTSTSEAYSFLFRLLCDPGDEVLIARPSYPLFQLLAEIDDVVVQEYPVFYETGAAPHTSGAWMLDAASLRESVNEKTRAIIVVHPNNPTGHYISEDERERLVSLCAERELALIVDEVFLDYSVGRDSGPRMSFASTDRCLCFVLSGISKVCALPQMKASWIVTCGTSETATEAMRRLEILADTFLSMNAPVQHALPVWLAQRHSMQDAIRERLQRNLAVLDHRLRGSLGERLSVEGGWTTILRVPRYVDGLPFAEAALANGVLVQPGELYGLPQGRCVLSLITPPEIWARGLAGLPL